MTKFLTVGAVNGRDPINYPYKDIYQEFFEPRVIEYAKHWKMEYRPFFEYPEEVRNGHTGLVWMKHWQTLEVFKESKNGDIISYMDSDILILRGDIELTTQKEIGHTINEAYFNQHPLTVFNNGCYALRDSKFTRDMINRIWNDMSLEHEACPDWWAWVNEIKKMSVEEFFHKVDVLPVTLNVMSHNRNKHNDSFINNIHISEIRFRHFANEHNVKFSKEALTEWCKIPLTFDKYRNWGDVT